MLLDYPFRHSSVHYVTSDADLSVHPMTRTQNTTASVAPGQAHAEGEVWTEGLADVLDSAQQDLGHPEAVQPKHDVVHVPARRLCSYPRLILDPASP